MKNIYLLSIGALVSLSALSGCAAPGEGWDPLGFDKVPETSGSRAAPLVVPPDASLAPPQTAAPRPQDASTAEQTIEALFGGSAQRSSTERAIISSAGSSDLGIRTSVGDPNTLTVNKGSVTRDIIAAPEGDGQSPQAVAGG